MGVIKQVPEDRLPTISMKDLQKQILQHRRDGKNMLQIAEIYDLSAQFITYCYKKALKTIIADDVKLLRNEEMMRLQELEDYLKNILIRFQPLICNGQFVVDITKDNTKFTNYVEDIGAKIAVVDRMLKVIAQRTELMGLSAPQRRTKTPEHNSRKINLTISKDDEQL